MQSTGEYGVLWEMKTRTFAELGCPGTLYKGSSGMLEGSNFCAVIRCMDCVGVELIILLCWIRPTDLRPNG